MATVGLAVWTSYFAEPSISNAGVVQVDFANPVIDEHVHKAKVSNNMLYAQMKESWETLPKEKKLELLNLIYDGGASRGYTQVNLLDKNGKPTGFESPTRLDIQTL